VIVFFTHAKEYIAVYISPFKSTRVALSIGGLATILASICCLGPFLFISIGLGSAWILYLLTLSESSRPFFIVLALIAICFAYQQIWHPKSTYNPGQICVTPQVKRTYKAYFLFVTMLVVTVLMLPYVVSDFN
jgi:mercuric ion transport protein